MRCATQPSSQAGLQARGNNFFGASTLRGSSVTSFALLTMRAPRLDSHERLLQESMVVLVVGVVSSVTLSSQTRQARSRVSLHLQSGAAARSLFSPLAPSLSLSLSASHRALSPTHPTPLPLSLHSPHPRAASLATSAAAAAAPALCSQRRGLRASATGFLPRKRALHPLTATATPTTNSSHTNNIRHMQRQATRRRWGERGREGGGQLRGRCTVSAPTLGASGLGQAATTRRPTTSCQHWLIHRSPCVDGLDCCTVRGGCSRDHCSSCSPASAVRTPCRAAASPPLRRIKTTWKCATRAGSMQPLEATQGRRGNSVQQVTTTRHLDHCARSGANPRRFAARILSPVLRSAVMLIFSFFFLLVFLFVV